MTDRLSYQDFMKMLEGNPHGWGPSMPSLEPAYDAPVQPGDETWRHGILPLRTVAGDRGEPERMEFALPGIAHEFGNALMAPGKAYFEGMSPEEINRSAASAAGFAMTGGLAAGPAEAAATNALGHVRDYGQAAYRGARYRGEAVVDPPEMKTLKRIAELETKIRAGEHTVAAQDHLSNVQRRMIEGTDDINDMSPSVGDERGYLNAILRQRDPELEAVLPPKGEPNLQFLDDVRYSDLDRRSKDAYGVGYEDLTPEQHRHITYGVTPKPTFRVIDGDLFSNGSKTGAGIGMVNADDARIREIIRKRMETDR